ncbi:alpha-E domain-containing protein [Pseudidiomarina terrestris]|uniref:Alpha-E domain-containing protein n=1 Tax=Pseudidiomarina terrestris TaxID=2820060 RepID=A0AAW7R2J3_9GAMM|nr:MULTISPECIES: alpha-E domain-containing protein [unclassified Pseudidiomarina]MDN7125192.1 alpha-E domain-containing protein [Pseudidiomarina sp. 1APP75-32.1]MDN7136119.1 alpha-E domain-containing protein [Pseudidiomarina sp. 1ASP75-5]
MLSRVASNIFWMGRYLERAENTARVINVNSHLLMDLPRTVKLGWEPIIDILSVREDFYENYEEADEHSVVKYMVTDKNNPSSIISSLTMARENARTIREILPTETWEQINSLYLSAMQNRASMLGRRHRYEALGDVIRSNQTITGMLSGTMTQDEGYAFLRIGRNLERGDMTTRIIDVRSATLLPELDTEQSAFENIQWMGVLKSMSAYQMYRREMRLRINRADVLKFLLQEPRFPRSLLHTLKQVKALLQELPQHDNAIVRIDKLRSTLLDAKPQSLKQDSLHEFIDEMQLGLIKIAEEINETYF